MKSGKSPPPVEARHFFNKYGAMVNTVSVSRRAACLALGLGGVKLERILSIFQTEIHSTSHLGRSTSSPASRRAIAAPAST